MITTAMAKVRTSMERTAPFGWRCLEDDYSSHLSPWEFDVRDITLPVVILQGGLGGNVPPGHARWLVQYIPDAELRFYRDDGQVSSAFSYRDEILATARGPLREGAGPR